MSMALAIIRAEHRNLGSVLSCFSALLDEVAKHGLTPDFKLFHAILDYLDNFLDVYHHPKEDAFLFPAVLKRAPHAQAALDRLQQEHRRELEVMHGLRKSLSRYEHEGSCAFGEFEERAREYIAFERAHAMREEREIFPLAEAHLNDEDWKAIEIAFSANQDPLFGVKKRHEYEMLLHKIANLAPAPYGAGPAWKKQD